MIDLQKLDLEYNSYKNIRKLYIKYKSKIEEFNKKYSKELETLLIKYNSIKNLKVCIEEKNKAFENFEIENPLIEEYNELDSKVKKYKNQLQQHSSTTQAFMKCSRFICLKHKEDDGYDLLDLSTNDKLDLNQYDNDKQQYILNDLKSNHSFVMQLKKIYHF